VGGHKEGDYIVLDKPDDDNDPIGKEREILSEWLSGRIHHVWTCNCFLDFRGFVDRQGQWNHERFKAADSALGEYMETIGKSDAFEKITRGFDPTKDPKARHFWEEEIILAGQDVLKMQLLLSCSRVTFKSLSGVEIEEYLTCGEWRKKGGGYAIQGNASYFVDDIEGSFTNIVGLPMPDVDMLLRKHYEIVPQTPV
jgi:predicted house-cleaning NTP pyrophosphatase (Maf/HAM1 superfamily)